MDEKERLTLEMIYRKQVEFAVGHTISKALLSTRKRSRKGDGSKDEDHSGIRGACNRNAWAKSG